MRLIVQRYNWPEWIWQFKYPGCNFVLGITNMPSVCVTKLPRYFLFIVIRSFLFQIRAQNQQDLIYKRGQAGITKASVTIVFDNSDRDKSPIGLENCKQITVTRQVCIPSGAFTLI